MLFLILSVFMDLAEAKEIALTFDDAPVASSLHFETNQRTDELIKKLKSLGVSGAMIFANPCKQAEADSIKQLKKYVDAGHVVANHSCSHHRLDDVGFKIYSEDVALGG